MTCAMNVRILTSRLFLLVLPFCGALRHTEFKVSVPNKPQVALHGQSVILSCTFSVGTSWQLSSTVITWKRGLEVIHDFYHSQDQLDWQSPHFASRTSLFTSEIKKGNASLKLDHTTPEDEGIYTCSVSTDMGSQKQNFHLKIAAEFKVSVPNTAQVALHGQSVILSCSFSVGTSWELSSTVIIWKRGLEVIHDFHHSQDQLDWQSPHFASRTSLFTSEIKKGNASLKLDHTTPEDEGIYTCSVSTDMGSQKQNFHLKIAGYSHNVLFEENVHIFTQTAHYSEPHLQLSKTTHGINLFMKSEGGYPAPTLLWLSESTEDLTNHTVTHLIQDTDTKLYNVYSTLTLTGVTNLSLTFVLRNEDLQQEIRREIELNLILENGANSVRVEKLPVFLAVLLIVFIF